jgi:AcrR family transcriptional regulator
MPVEHTGASDPARTIELLWGLRADGARGPKPTLTVERIVAAAIEIADRAGMEELSMRRVAEQLDVGTMSLYRYVPGKAELLDVMVDRVCAEAATSHRRARTWRARLERVARVNRELLERHPWLLQVSTVHPPLGPGMLAKYEAELGAVDGIGLTDVEMDSVVSLVVGFVHAAVGTALDAARARTGPGQSDEEWWNALAPHLERVFDPQRYPLAARVGVAATEHYAGAYDPQHAFEFGLRRVLDGIEVLVERRRVSDA